MTSETNTSSSGISVSGRRLAATVAAFALAACGEVTATPDSGPGECTTPTWLPVALANASFDDDGAWTVSPLNNPAICEPGMFGVPADSGTLAACFGVVNLANQMLTQPVTLPPGATQVRLRGKGCLVTTEPDPAVKDTLDIELLDANTLETVASLANWSNLDAGMVCAWTDFELMAPVESAGPPILSMHGVLDDLEITTFFLDTLELDAYGC